MTRMHQYSPRSVNNAERPRRPNEIALSLDEALKKGEGRGGKGRGGKGVRLEAFLFLKQVLTKGIYTHTYLCFYCTLRITYCVLFI